MGRFASTVAYYESARPPYGEAFFFAVAEPLGFDRNGRLLDVGTGPGLLAIGFAPFFGEVVAIDPEAAMLEAARSAVERAGVAVQLIEGRFETLPEDIGTFEVVTIGRAIHWLDPEPAQRTLDRIVASQGMTLVCHAASVADGRNPWLDVFHAVRGRWSGERPKRDHSAVFAGGRFVARETIRIETAYAVPIERLADRVLSMSASSAERLGDEVPAMRRAILEALAPFAADSVIDEIVEARAEVYQAGM
jgi:SAM-dependent methyltransferase